MAAVVTDVGQILLIDLCLDDLSCSQNEVEASGNSSVCYWETKIEHFSVVCNRTFGFFR